MKKDNIPEKSDCRCGRGVSRRQFFTTLGTGALTVAVSGHIGSHAAHGAAAVIEPDEMAKVMLMINGNSHKLLVEPRWSLLFVLREKLGLTGAKLGCGRGECGACTILIDDVPRYACLTLAVEAEGKSITTIEGLMEGEKMGPVQEAFLEKDGYQCGYCTPGQIMAAEGLLRSVPDPSMEEIVTGVSGNLCRCGAYVNIFKSVQRAAGLKRAK